MKTIRDLLTAPPAERAEALGSWLAEQPEGDERLADLESSSPSA